jgi:hypothetical protein
VLLERLPVFCAIAWIFRSHDFWFLRPVDHPKVKTGRTFGRRGRRGAKSMFFFFFFFLAL